MHDWLATGAKIRQRYNTNQPCPHCTGKENRDHIIRCPAQKTTQANFITNLQQKLTQWRTEPGLKSLIIQYLTTNTGTYHGTKKNKPWTQQLLTEQFQIGPSKIWLGFMSQTWGDIQEAFHRREHHHASLTGTLWTKRLIIQLWQFFLDQWTIRNNKLHNNNAHKSIQHEQLRNQMENLYRKHCIHTGEYKFLFKKNILTLKKHNRAYLQRWIDLAEMIPKNNDILQKRQRRYGTDIKKFLSQSSHPPPRI